MGNISKGNPVLPETALPVQSRHYHTIYTHTATKTVLFFKLGIVKIV